VTGAVDEGAEEELDTDDTDDAPSGKQTKVEWVEEIIPSDGSPGRFYLRVGLGRKASGSYYTPESFVRVLVEETLRPQVDERSPKDDPKPREVLKLKGLDPAMGSGHFLVGACRYLGERLYESCRNAADRAGRLCHRNTDPTIAPGTCDACVHDADRNAEICLWDRIPADVLPYLPGRVQEGEAEVGASAEKARALCKRLVAVHCLYGVDKNALAVELAKVCLWLESQAEGMPLTFLDHRLVHGDSLTGPFWLDLTYYPGKPEQVEKLWAQGVQDRLTSVLQNVSRLQDTLGANPYEFADKQRLKREIDTELLPFHVLAMTWSGGVMLGKGRCDDQGHAELLQHVAQHGELPERLDEGLLRMLEVGSGLPELPAEREGIKAALEHQVEEGESKARALAYDLTFPEVFYPTAVVYDRKGFHAMLGNPP
jgi:hypothetical protein